MSRECVQARRPSMTTKERPIPRLTAKAALPSPACGDQRAEDRRVAVAQGEFGMPLDAEAEALAWVLDAFDDAVGRRRIDDDTGADRLDRLMMRRIDRQLGRAVPSGPGRAAFDSDDVRVAGSDFGFLGDLADEMIFHHSLKHQLLARSRAVQREFCRQDGE